MKLFKSICALFIAQLLLSSAVYAQANRTWVSGVGDDANPCSRTAPCKTFAGAISKTAVAGEINALDPGSFGAVTITKSITISSESFEAGILASGTNGIIINGAGITVTLRGLDIEGVGAGLSGVKIVNASIVHVEDCTINNFTLNGIDVVSTSAVNLFVKDTTIRNNRGASSAGIAIAPPGGSSVSATLDQVKLQRNKRGIVANELSSVTISNSLISGSGANGITVVSATSSSAVNIVDTIITNNGGSAISSEGVGAQVRISGLSIFSNAIGLNSVTGGQIVSFSNNSVFGNGTNGSASAKIMLQ